MNTDNFKSSDTSVYLCTQFPNYKGVTIAKIYIWDIKPLTSGS